MTDYLELLRKNNPASGLRKPMIDEGFNAQMMSSTQPSLNLGMGDLMMPKNQYMTDAGTGINPPSSFGQMPNAAKSNMNVGAALSLLDAGQEKSANMQMPQLPGGSNLTYAQLMKMYGMTGLLG
jgi:hypothetical protein